MKNKKNFIIHNEKISPLIADKNESKKIVNELIENKNFQKLMEMLSDK